MTQKLRISKSGYNAITESDLDNIVYDSEYDTLKYYTSGLLSISINKALGSGAYEQVTYVEHNLGYYPFYQVFVEHDGSGIYRMIGNAYILSGGFPYAYYRKMEAFVTTTRLYVKLRGDVQTSADSYTANFRYKIFRNDLGF